MKIDSTQFIWLAFLGSISLLVGAYAFEGFARIKGIKRISGGIGKNELSVNATIANAHNAYGVADRLIVQL